MTDARHHPALMSPQEANMRKHADLFTVEEAKVYLHLENVATIDHLRREKLLTGYVVGRQIMFWKEDLDDCALKMVGRVPDARPKLKPLGDMRIVR